MRVQTHSGPFINGFSERPLGTADPLYAPEAHGPPPRTVPRGAGGAAPAPEARRASRRARLRLRAPGAPKRGLEPARGTQQLVSAATPAAAVGVPFVIYETRY